MIFTALVVHNSQVGVILKFMWNLLRRPLHHFYSRVALFSLMQHNSIIKLRFNIFRVRFKDELK